LFRSFEELKRLEFRIKFTEQFQIKSTKMLQPSTVHNLAQQLHSLERERQTLQRKLDESLTKRTLLTALNHQLSNDDEIIRNGLVRKLNYTATLSNRPHPKKSLILLKRSMNSSVP